MAQVKIKNEKSKKSAPKAKTIVDNEVKETIVVNDKQEIIYDEVAELENAIKNMGLGNTDIVLPDIANEAIAEIKEVSKMTEKMNVETQETAKDDIEKAIEKLTEIEKKLEKDVAEKTASLSESQKNNLSRFSGKIDFTSFWNGISDGWN